MTTYEPIIGTSPDVLSLLAQQVVLAKRAAQDAEAVYKRAQQQIIDGLLSAAQESVVTPDGTVVTLKGGLDGEVRRSVSLEGLADRVTATTLDRVTKRSVDLSAFDSAVEVGLIDNDTVEAVVSHKAVARSVTITSPIKR